MSQNEDVKRQLFHIVIISIPTPLQNNYFNKKKKVFKAFYINGSKKKIVLKKAGNAGL